jgi:hypothetical protein
MACVNKHTANQNFNHMNQKTEITGKALNAKSGAIIEVGKDFYYIDGLEQWPKNIYGKTIIVVGDLRIIDTDTSIPDQEDNSITMIDLPYKKIYNAKWKIKKKWYFF